MEDLRSVSDHLRHSKNDVLREWEKRVRERLSAARSENHFALRNSVPDFLDDLVKGLSEGFVKVSDDITHFAHKHGSERAHHSSYSIEDVLAEYNILRQILFQYLETKSQLPSSARDLILEGIQIGMAKATAEYAKLQKERAQETNNLLETVLNQMPAGVLITAVPSGKVLRWNQRASELFPKSSEFFRLNGTPILEKDYPIARTIRTGEQVSEQMMIRRPDSTTIHVRLRSAPILDPEGKMFAVATIADDITHIKEKEFELKDALKRLKQITDTQPTLIAQVDKDLRYTFVNEAYHDWFGVPTHKILGKTVGDFMGEDVFKMARPYYLEALAGKKVSFEATVPFRTQARHILGTYCPGFDDNGEVESVYVSILDITEQKATLDALHEETALRDKFVSTLSHDLRTPLTAAKMSAELIRRKIKDNSALSLSSRIIDNLDRANKMIEDLLDASKVRAGKEIVPDLRETEVVEVVERTLEDLSTIHGDRFILSAPEKVEAWLDPFGLRRILENLCSNAIKYGSPSEPVKVTISQSNQELSLSVHNHGHPLINVDKRRLFEPFHRGEGTSSTKGWGIGLTIVRGITEAHRGEVNIDTSSKGTSFTIRLPLDARKAREESQHLH